MPPAATRPNSRELDLAREAHADDEAARASYAFSLARYREELLAPLVELRIDYDAMGDIRVAEDLHRILVMARGKGE